MRLRVEGLERQILDQRTMLLNVLSVHACWTTNPHLSRSDRYKPDVLFDPLWQEKQVEDPQDIHDRQDALAKHRLRRIENRLKRRKNGADGRNAQH